MSATVHSNQLSMRLSALLLAPLILLQGGTFFLPIIRLLLTGVTQPALNLGNYRRLIAEPLYIQVILRTIWIALACTGGSLLLGYPVAALMARPGRAEARRGLRDDPLCTSVLVRSYAWIMLMDRKGVINTVLLHWGVIARPLTLLYPNGAVLLAMTPVLLSFMVLPIYAALRGLPSDLTWAAANLGAGRGRIFLEVILPLSLPVVFAGCLLVFVMALGFYVTPALVGGPQTLMIATLIGQQATELLNWPFAGAISCVLLVLSMGMTLAFKRLLRLERVIAHDEGGDVAVRCRLPADPALSPVADPADRADVVQHHLLPDVSASRLLARLVSRLSPRSRVDRRHPVLVADRRR